MKKGPGTVRYVRAIERALGDRGDRPFVLSPRDYARARDWYARGIPLGLVLEALEERSPRGRGVPTGRRPGLAHVARAVEESWDAVRDGRVSRPGIEESGPLPTVADALDRWRRARDAAADGSALRSLLDRCLGALERGDTAQSLDAALDAAIAGAASPDLVARVETEADHELQPFRRRMEPRVFEATRNRSVVDRLRRALDLPRLALTRDPRPSRR